MARPPELLPLRWAVTGERPVTPDMIDPGGTPNMDVVRPATLYALSPDRAHLLETEGEFFGSRGVAGGELLTLEYAKHYLAGLISFIVGGQRAGDPEVSRAASHRLRELLACWSLFQLSDGRIVGPSGRCGSGWAWRGAAAKNPLSVLVDRALGRDWPNNPPKWWNLQSSVPAHLWRWAEDRGHELPTIPRDRAERVRIALGAGLRQRIVLYTCARGSYTLAPDGVESHDNPIVAVVAPSNAEPKVLSPSSPTTNCWGPQGWSVEERDDQIEASASIDWKDGHPDGARRPWWGSISIGLGPVVSSVTLGDAPARRGWGVTPLPPPSPPPPPKEDPVPEKPDTINLTLQPGEYRASDLDHLTGPSRRWLLQTAAGIAEGTARPERLQEGWVTRVERPVLDGRRKARGGHDAN